MSVKITGFKHRESQEGKPFITLTLQGDVEIVKSSNGKSYVTVRKASLPTTFDEATCMALLGTELPGSIEKIECELYEYTNPQTGEVFQLTHRYEYLEAPKEPQRDFTKFYEQSSNGVHKVEQG